MSRMKKAKEGPGAAPAPQPENIEHFLLLQEGQDRTQEQDRPRGRLRRAAQTFRNQIGASYRGIMAMMTKAMAKHDTMPTERLASAPSVDHFGERIVSGPREVPAFVRNVHQRLTSNTPPDDRLFIDILRLTDMYPTDVVFTLLDCAPSCDRAAAIMWKTIASSATTLENVLPKLLCVMEDWPWHSTSTSDGHKTHVFALAVSIVIWQILRLPWCPDPLVEYCPPLLVHLLFQVFITTKEMPEKVAALWRRCQEQHGLPVNPSRFAVQTVRALLRRMQCLNLVMAVERKRGWDTLLHSDTHHYAMGLLAREMRRATRPLCSRIALCLLGVLSREKAHWELSPLAFLVEVLDCLDMRECGDSILHMLSKHLQSQCPQRRRLALKGLVVLSKDPVMAGGMRSLTQSLLELLGDADGELVAMALSVFLNEVQDRHIQITIPTALRLALALQPLFDNDNIQVQLFSIQLFQKVMELVVEEEKNPLKKHVIHSLLPLFFCWHDENQHVAEASRDALLCAAKFLRRTDLIKALKTEQPLTFSECLMENVTHRALYLRQALPYLGNHREPLREAALRFTGTAMGHMKGQQEEQQLLCEALQAMRKDDCPSNTSVMVQALFEDRAAVLNSTSGSRKPVSLEQHQIPRNRTPRGHHRRSSRAPDPEAEPN